MAAPVRQTFSSYAYYCDPRYIPSIRQAVINAYEAPRSGSLRAHLLRDYTWEYVANKLLEAYETVLRGDGAAVAMSGQNQRAAGPEK
jgi:glycosyltransferase involved in cell wall biosynthesis